MVTPGVLPDLQSGIKKCPNLFRLCGFAIRSKGVCFSFYWGITNPPVFIGRTFFYGGFQIRRDAWRGCALDTPSFFSGVNRLTVNSCFLHGHPRNYSLYISLYIIHYPFSTISSASSSSSATSAVRFALSLADLSCCLKTRQVARK